MLHYDLSLGGSGKGISYWLQYGNCPVRAVLDSRIRGGAGKLALITPTAPSDQPDGASVGTLYHAFLEIWRSGLVPENFAASSVDFRLMGDTLPIEEKIRIKAEHLFECYRALYPRDLFGRPEQLRHEFGIGGTDHYNALNDVGLPRDLTCRIDLVTKKLSKRDCERIYKLRGVQVFPGRYILDYKTTKAHTKTLVAEHLNSPQPVVYQIAYEAVTGMEIEGALIDVGIKTKEPKFLLIRVPRPSRAQRDSVLRFLRVARTLPSDFANLAHCYSFFRECPHLSSGACSR